MFTNFIQNYSNCKAYRYSLRYNSGVASQNQCWLHIYRDLSLYLTFKVSMSLRLMCLIVVYKQFIVSCICMLGFSGFHAELEDTMSNLLNIWYHKCVLFSNHFKIQTAKIYPVFCYSLLSDTLYLLRARLTLMLARVFLVLWIFCMVSMNWQVPL